MADKLDDVRAIFNAAGVPMDRDDTWEVQRTPVVKHKALERLAAALKIQFERPTILRCERDESVLVVVGSIGDHVEWSTGEALVVLMVDTGRTNKWGKPEYEAPAGVSGNYQITPKQAAYPYAMAEKRGKDRVILKLANLAGVYSEEEADAFKQPTVEYAPPAERTESPPAGADEVEALIAEMKRVGRGWKRVLDLVGSKTKDELTSAQVARALTSLRSLPDALVEAAA